MEILIKQDCLNILQYIIVISFCEILEICVYVRLYISYTINHENIKFYYRQLYH